MDRGNFHRLAFVNIFLLAAYAIADLSAWAAVSNIQYITRLLWGPLYIAVNWDSFSGSSGLILTPNMSFMYLIALITVNLALAHQDSRKTVLANFLILLFYLDFNYWTWSQIISAISPIGSGLQWDFLVILVGWNSTQGGVIADVLMILPNWTLIIAVVLATINGVYVRRTIRLSSKTRRTIEKKMDRVL